MDKAVQIYQEQGAKELSERNGYRATCKAIEEECWHDTKVKIKLDKTTLSHRLCGVKSQASVMSRALME